MKPTVVAKNIKHLKGLIEAEIEFNGHNCDLNHLDVSKIKSFRHLFRDSKFNGNISRWDVSNVKDMDYMFEKSSFDGDLSDWKPYKVNYPKLAFFYSNTPIVYWSNYNDQDERKKAIDNYHLQKELGQELSENSTQGKKMKL